MSLWFMRDNHTFTRLDTLPVNEAMECIERLVADNGGYGFLGTRGATPASILQWSPGQPWHERALALLRAQHTSRPLFLYPLGATVRWVGEPKHVSFRIIQRRITERLGAGDIIEYRLTAIGHYSITPWAYEADISPEEGEGK